MIRMLVAFVLASTPFNPAAAGVSAAQAREAAMSLDAESRATLGIGIRSVSILFHAGPGRFLLVDSLKSDGSWPLLEDLEKRGFVSISSRSAVEGEIVNIQLTDAGRAIVDTLAAP